MTADYPDVIIDPSPRIKSPSTNSIDQAMGAQTSAPNTTEDGTHAVDAWILYSLHRHYTH